MSGSIAFPGKPLVLAAAIAAALPLGGCSTLSGSAYTATPIYPIQRQVGMVGQFESASDYDKGKAHFQAGRYGLALGAFEAELTKHPRSVAALNGIAAVYDQLGRYDLAVSYYYRALQIDPDSARTLGNLGYSFLLQGKPAAARGVLEMAASLAPDNAVIVRNLAMATERMAAAQPAGGVIAAQAPAEQTSPLTEMGVPATTAHEAAVAEPMVSVASSTTPEPASAVAPDSVATVVVNADTASTDSAVAAQAAEVGNAVESMPNRFTASAAAHAATYASAMEVAEVESVPAVRPVAESAASSQAAGEAPLGVVAQDSADGAMAVSHEAAVAVQPASRPVSASVTGRPAASEAAGAGESAVVVIDRAIPDAVRSISQQTGHVQLAFDTPEGTVEVSNGNGYEGMAGLLSRYYSKVGQQIAHVTNAGRFDHVRTVIYYRAGKREVAESLRDRLPVAAALREAKGIRTDARVVLGKDIGFYQGAIQRVTKAQQVAGASVGNDPVGFAPVDARIEVSNGNGRRGMARLLGRVLGYLGESVTRVTNADNFRYPVTQIHYAPDREDDARALAARLPVEVELKPVPAMRDSRNVGVRVIIGRDFLRYERVMSGLLAATVSEETGA